MTDEVLSINETNVPDAGKPRWTQAVNTGSGLLDVVWRGLCHRRLLLASCSVVLLLILSSYYLRQLPSQLNDDPLAAARWLMTTSAEYGLAGELMRNLGLFNLAHSPLLHFLLALIGLILFVQLGDLISATRRIRPVMSQPPNSATGSVPLANSTLRPLYRWRQAYAAPPDQAVQALRDRLTAHFDSIQVVTVAGPTAATEPESELPTGDPAEIRLLATRYWRWALLRPLGLLGLLILWGVIWLTLTFGWAVMPPALAPGAEYRYAAHELVLQYQVPEQVTDPAPHLAVQVGTTQKELPATRQSWARIGSVEVETALGPPGLLISTVGAKGNGEPLLGRSGQSNTTAAIGLVFPNPGSEETLILAKAAVLRIVRMADDDKNLHTGTFALEVYQDSDKKPVQRLQISETQTATMALNGEKIALRFTPLPGLDVEVHYLPAAWLLWVAIILILIGALAFWCRPGFLLAQITSWPEDRSALIVQGDEQNEVEALRVWVGDKK
ncbi:MAG: hypothetical protein NT075_19240 [Chloroflexi bacterium]|nr:hypothetical protein [Chloroflexota bacterium]